VLSLNKVAGKVKDPPDDVTVAPLLSMRVTGVAVALQPPLVSPDTLPPTEYDGEFGMHAGVAVEPLQAPALPPLATQLVPFGWPPNSFQLPSVQIS
jgi:hypothetical protein